MLAFHRLDMSELLDAATLVAREQATARVGRSQLPIAYTDPKHCLGELEALLADGYIGVAASTDHGCAGLMCGRTTASLGFVPAHGIAVDPDLKDPTTIVAGLFAELAPMLLRQGATRFTIDHIDLDPLGAALHHTGFGGGSVFAIQPARPSTTAPDISVRIGTSDDLDAIAALSQIEYAHRSTPPIYAPPLPRTLTQARAEHHRLLDEGAIHFVASDGERDIGLLTVEFVSPSPRLFPDTQPYIGPTATRPSARGHGVGAALVAAALDWAHHHGHATVAVDYDSPNPLSRPFWIGLGFRTVGYRSHRTIDPSYSTHPHHGPNDTTDA